jgi:hypothetical protein
MFSLPRKFGATGAMLLPPQGFHGMKMYHSVPTLAVRRVPIYVPSYFWTLRVPGVANLRSLESRRPEVIYSLMAMSLGSRMVHRWLGIRLAV